MPRATTSLPPSLTRPRQESGDTDATIRPRLKPLPAPRASAAARTHERTGARTPGSRSRFRTILEAAGVQPGARLARKLRPPHGRNVWRVIPTRGLSSPSLAIAKNNRSLGQAILGKDAKTWIVVGFAATAFLAASLFHTINLPWVEEDNCFGAFYSQAAYNNLRAGLGTTGGVPATLYFGPLPIPPDAYYVHHPILVPLMVTGIIAIFGE